MAPWSHGWNHVVGDAWPESCAVVYLMYGFLGFWGLPFARGIGRTSDGSNGRVLGSYLGLIV